jgi:hypothetical protein
MRGLRSSVRWRVVRLVELVDAVPGIVRTARTVKRRRRGVSAGALQLPPPARLPATFVVRRPQRDG